MVLSKIFLVCLDLRNGLMFHPDLTPKLIPLFLNFKEFDAGREPTQFQNQRYHNGHPFWV